MKNSVFAGAFLVGTALLFVPADMAQAKEIPADGNIPLTSEYFPDEWFLNDVAWYDKNKDGILSSEEISAITKFWCAGDLTDFSQVQYFTNLRELTLEPEDETDEYDIWVGDEIDLTAFPCLESARLFLDSRKAPAGASDIRVQASGLEHLKSFEVHDKGSNQNRSYSGADAKIGIIDLRRTPALEVVKISDAKGVVFDDGSQVKDIQIINVQEPPSEQLGKLSELENLYIWANVAGYTSQDVSQNSSLKKLELKNEYLENVTVTGAANLESIAIESRMLTNIDLSKNRKLTRICMDCPKLEALQTEENPKLDYLMVRSDRMASINISKNTALTTLSMKCGRLDVLDVTRNTNLEYLYLNSNSIKKLDLKKNKNLTDVSVLCKRVTSLDFSGNPKLARLVIDGTPVQSLNISRQKELTGLTVCNNHVLRRLDLSQNKKLCYLTIENTWLKSVNTSKQRVLKWFHLKGNKKLKQADLQKNKSLNWLIINGSKKLTSLDLSENKKLQTIDVKGNALKMLKLGEKPSLQYIYCQNNKLKVLDITGVCTEGIYEVWCDNSVKVKGYKGKITRV